jgi:regulation of enolase protein 1 (concanavalin A-like superfamily)
MKKSRIKNLRTLLPACLGVFLTFASAQAEQVIFTEIQYNAKSGQPDFLEVSNNTATPFDMGLWYFSDGIEYTFPDFSAGDSNAHILKDFETILVSPVDAETLRAAYPDIPATTRIFGPYTGALSNSGETVTLSDKNGIVMTTIEYNDGGKWPAAADGTGHTLTRINPNLSGAEWRNWISSAAPGGTPGRGPVSEDKLPTTTTQITATTSAWKYDQNQANLDRGTTWREPEFDDSGWPEGPGPFGINSGDSFSTPWTVGGRFTYYLRQEFQFNDSFSSATIDIASHLDDGMVVYLNGQEITRFNMPIGEITYDTPASSGREWDDLAEIASGVNISAALRTGTNVLAVEVHNRANNSSDIAFGADISITAAAQPANPLANLVFSEIHFGLNGNIDWIELHAPGNSPVSAAGLKFSPTRSLTNTVALSGSIPAGGYVSFPVTLAIDENGDIDLFLIQGSTVIDSARLDRDRGEEGFQSYPVGQEWFGGMGHTQDAPNNPSARQTSIVINEIMYDAPSDQGTAEYIELFNRGSESVDLSGWKISDGVKFDFPTGTTLAAGSYLVIAADSNCLAGAHPGLAMIGDWEGGLRDGGELLRIEDQNGNLVDEVDYLPGGDWPNLADGDGSSMELRHPDMDNNVATAWADSDESQKSTLESFSYTSEFVRSKWLALTRNQELHTHLVGDSHVILENISVKHDNTGSNLLGNPNVMSPTASSASGWVCQGTHWASFIDSGKLNLIADGHGDNKANRAEVDFATDPIIGQNYTLSFDARWVSGKSRIIFQTLDHGFGTTFLLPIPENLGTPGAANSAALGAAAPTVAGIIHSPAVPGTSAPVSVSARIDSAATLTSVELVHRLSSNNGNAAWIRVPMTNDGTGLYLATVSNNTSKGDVTEFYVEAKSGSNSTTQPRLGAARPAMWIVDPRDMPSTFLQERFIVALHDRRALTESLGGGTTFDYNFPRMSNHFFNATFIANESEIYYNAEIRKSGSPFTRSSNSNLDHGKWKLPGDRLFRGRRRSVIDASGTSQGSGTPRFYDDRIARYFLYQLGHPINEMEFVHSVINDDDFKVRENHEPISNDFLSRNFPGGSDGTLLRIDDEWRFTTDDGTTRSSRDADWSYKDTENPIAYHSEWIMRTRESDYDYGSFIELTRLLDENKLEETTLDRIANADMLALNAAVRGYDADWDTLTVNRGKNAYFFRPKDGKGWMLLHWDGDRVFANTNQAILGGRAGVSKYFARPFVRRLMNYYMTKLLDEHTKGSARTLAWMQAETNSIAGTEVRMTTSHYTNWFNNRENLARNFVTTAVANTNFAITTSNAATSDNIIILNGTSPPTVFKIRVAGQSDTSLTWTSKTDWEMTGVVLKEGANVLMIEGVDHEGVLVEQVQFNITKTGNAPPVIVLNSSIKSRNVALDKSVILDASESYDPDGDDLVFNWQILPTTGASLALGDMAVTATFTKPGFYLLTSTVSDPNANSTVKTVGLSVHLAEQFSNFGDPALESFWTPFKTEKHGNSSNAPHYTLQDQAGRLTINIPVSYVPLGLPAPILPPPLNYVQLDSVWKYDDSNQDLTGIFAQPAYDDSSWSSGPGFLGFNQNGLPAPGLQTGSLTRGTTTAGLPHTGLITYYFRTEFEFTGDPIGAQLTIDHIVDDGVRYYLNGQVLGSVRLPDGVIDSKTTAQALSPENVIEEDIIALDVSASIVEGTNVLAAEVHNSAANSSDLVFGSRVDIAANAVAEGSPDLDDALHPWVRRPLPSGNWILQTEVKLEKAQFGQFYAGLLVQANQTGNTFRYGVGFKDGDSIAAIKVNPSGSSEILTSLPAIEKDTAVIRLERKGDLLTFSWMQDRAYTQVHQLTLPADTTFSIGGVFASTEVAQSLEASFDYAMLISSSADFTSWMSTNGFGDPSAEYDNSGMSNLLAYALGRDLNPTVAPAITSQGTVIGFNHRQRIIGGQISYRVEKSVDLMNWEPAGDLSPSGEPVLNTDGTYTVQLLSNIPTTTRPETYYRLIVSLQ